MPKKYALLIGNDRYQDDHFSPLTVSGSDIESLAAVLSDPKIGGFDRVDTLLNESMNTIMGAIGDLFSDKTRDDLLLLYFSGHGALDSSGQLYLAVANTNYKRLSTTSVWSSIIKNEMNNSRSRRQVLILDCCYAGAFSRNAVGAKSGQEQAAVDATTFDVKGYGREILVSSSATQRSWEGNKIIGDTDKSLFTHFMVQGLQTGQAAIQGQSQITLGQLYDYVHDKVVDADSNMTPQRWVEAQKDSIVIAQNPNPAVVEIFIPEDLNSDLESSKPHIREGAVRELGRLADSGDQTEIDLVTKVLTERQRVERDIYVCKAIDDVLARSSEVVKVETGLIKPKFKLKNYLFAGFILVLIPLLMSKKIESIISDLRNKPVIENVSDLELVENSTPAVLTIPIPGNVTEPKKVVEDIPAIKTKPIRTAGTIFQDTLKDGLKGPEMVVIPSGKFRMGDVQNTGDNDEKPVHDITIAKPFALGKYPVTFAEYDYFCEKNGEEKPKDEGWGRDKRPVINVSWQQAVAYAKWLSTETGKHYRLASYAEWEYAARADPEIDGWWGNEPSQEYANYEGEKTSPVDKYKPNDFGLHDMVGDVWEWINDCYHDSYKDKAINDGSAWVSNSCETRVLRGGSWSNRSGIVSSADHTKNEPLNRDYLVGFRLAQDL